MDYTLLFFDFGTGEIFIIIMMIFLVFGPSKIPELAKKIGRGAYEVKRASNEIKREIDSEVRRIEREVDLKKTVENKQEDPQGSVSKEPKQNKDQSSETNSTKSDN